MNEPIKILIVDDEERLLRVLRLGLKPLGYDVRTADNAEEALQEILARPYDIVLTDLQMPKMRGDELVYELERLQIKIPLIVMTAHADVDTATKTLKHGAADYIKKPFTVDEINDIVRKTLQERTPHASAPLGSLKDGVEQKEKELIEKALLKVRNNKTAAAKLLDISERTLWYKIKKYRIDT